MGRELHRVSHPQPKRLNDGHQMNNLNPKQLMVLGMFIVDICLAFGPMGLRGALSFAGVQIFLWGLFMAARQHALELCAGRDYRRARAVLEETEGKGDA